MRKYYISELIIFPQKQAYLITPPRAARAAFGTPLNVTKTHIILWNLV